jgi:hypothetical protein
MTGRLVHHKGGLARAVLPFVVHLRWGWHRVERAMQRGKMSLDALFDHAFTWCVANLPVEPVRLGCERRELVAIDTSTIVRLRAGTRLALAGKGFRHRRGAQCGRTSSRRPWDRKPTPSAGRLANHLDIHVTHLSTIALNGVEPRNHRIMQNIRHINIL